VEMVSSSRTAPARPAASPASRENPVQSSHSPATSSKTPCELPHIIGKDGINTSDSHPTSKRSTPRYACHIPVNYCQEGTDKTSLKAYSKDIAALGLHLLSNRPQKTGDKLKIEVEMPNHEKAVLQAVVCWTHWVPQNLRSVEMPGFGVKITNAPEAWFSYFMNKPQPAHAHL